MGSQADFLGLVTPNLLAELWGPKPTRLSWDTSTDVRVRARTRHVEMTSEDEGDLEWLKVGLAPAQSPILLL